MDTLDKMDWNRLNTIYYGGDYNPDQWDASVWLKDMEMLAKMNANVLTLPVFSWAKLQSSEAVFHFEWLDQIFNLAEAKGFSINLATPTAAQPAWMSKAYPDILPVDKHGIKRQHGARTNFCPNSPSYRRFSRDIALRLAKRYQHRQALILWHVNNEYGTHCYCENCRLAFISWLQQKYGTLEALNRAWYTDFWGHTYYHWDEIQTVSYRTELLQNGLGARDGTTFQGMAIDYQRFMSDSILECYLNEASTLKSITPQIPVTTNIWGIGPWLDLFKVGRAVDVVSWDSYPRNDEHYSVSAFKHDIIRSLKKGNSFMLMEQTPNQQNWQAYNAVKRPGVMRLMSYQTMAHGADALMFFQVRQSRGACEKYHAAMIPHADHLETRTGRELMGLGQELRGLGEVVLGTAVAAKVALVMNWNNWWSVGYSSGPSIDLNYFEILHEYYQVLNKLNLEVDVVEPGEDLSAYALVVAPLLNMVSEAEKKNLEAYVREGGTLVSGYFSGIVDENDLVYMGGYPGALRSLMGIWVEEVDALTPEDRNRICEVSKSEPATNWEARLICEVIHLEGAKALAYYGDDFYAGTPCVTQNSFGKGTAIYLGTQPERAYLEALLGRLPAVSALLEKQIFERVENVEITTRTGPHHKLYFVMNHSDDTQRIGIKEGLELALEAGLEPVLPAQLEGNVLVLRPKALAILKGSR